MELSVRRSASAWPPTVAAMITETPALRAQQRLGAASGNDEQTEGDGHADDDTALSRWLPETASGGPGWLAAVRADPGRAGAVALTVIGVVAVLVTVFTVFGDDRPPVASAKLPAVQKASSSAAPAPAGAAAIPKGAEEVVVSVVGLVHKPGLVTLPGGARIADALTAAGGALDGADLIGLNMARRLADGEQILVGVTAPLGTRSSGASAVGPANAAPAAHGAAGAAVKGVVDLNVATADQLDALPGVGPVMAAAIVAWRDKNGRFTAVEQLGEVDGIGPVRLEKLRELVRV